MSAGHVGMYLLWPCSGEWSGKASYQFPKPTTKKQVRSFLGLTGNYHRFILQYATIAAPLTNLTKKSEPDKVNWTVECGKAFKKLKEILVSSAVMRNPNISCPFVLQTDASEVGVGAVLDDVGLDHPIAYFSRKLLLREQKFSTIEKERLAIKLP